MRELEEHEPKLKKEYEDFLRTEAGKVWIELKKEQNPPDKDVDFGDYLYDFYPEYLVP